jgi:hypothetical protein
MQDSLHVRASYEPRRNLIINVDGNTLRQSYLLSSQVSRIQSLAFSGRLLVSPKLGTGRAACPNAIPPVSRPITSFRKPMAVFPPRSNFNTATDTSS